MAAQHGAQVTARTLQDVRLALRLSASRKHHFALRHYKEFAAKSFFQMEEVDFISRNHQIKSLISMEFIFSLI
jgi:hypothetical protein